MKTIIGVIQFLGNMGVRFPRAKFDMILDYYTKMLSDERLVFILKQCNGLVLTGPGFKVGGRRPVLLPDRASAMGPASAQLSVVMVGGPIAGTFWLRHGI